MVAPAWKPSTAKGERTYTWTWGDYVLKPVDARGYSPRYRVFFKGALLDPYERCLFRSRRLAEQHARTGEVRS